jgi:hypothetical protein
MIRPDQTPGDVLFASIIVSDLNEICWHCDQTPDGNMCRLLVNILAEGTKKDGKVFYSLARNGQPAEAELPLAQLEQSQPALCPDEDVLPHTICGE